MAVFTTETKQAWQAVIDDTSNNRPSVGRQVTITKGKNKGASGRVTWHGVDAYASTQYKTEAMLAMQQVIGREGYRIRVQPVQGAAFFCKATCAEVNS